MDKHRFEQSPCYLCGYNGKGYYQPAQHKCAAEYHSDDPITTHAMREQCQRERLQERLGDRAKGPVNLDDCGVPHLREE